MELLPCPICPRYHEGPTATVYKDDLQPPPTQLDANNSHQTIMPHLAARVQLRVAHLELRPEPAHLLAQPLRLRLRLGQLSGGCLQLLAQDKDIPKKLDQGRQQRGCGPVAATLFALQWLRAC